MNVYENLMFLQGHFVLPEPAPAASQRRRAAPVAAGATVRAAAPLPPPLARGRRDTVPPRHSLGDMG